MRIRLITLALLVLFAGTLVAQGQPATVAREIGQLFVALEQSGCQFYRNGSWHSSHQAGVHLRRKYAYLVKKGLVTTTESFIDLAATKSSMSGKPYRVRCPGSPAIPSKVWFAKELVGLRHASTGPDASFKPESRHALADIRRWAALKEHEGD